MSHTKGSSDVREEERLSRNVRDQSHNVAAPAVPGPFGARGPCSPPRGAGGGWRPHRLRLISQTGFTGDPVHRRCCVQVRSFGGTGIRRLPCRPVTRSPAVSVGG